MQRSLIAGLVLGLGMLAACSPATTPEQEPPALVVEPPANDDLPTPPPFPSHMSPVPDLTPANFIMKPIGDLMMTGTESPSDIGQLLQTRFGSTETVEGNYEEQTVIQEEGANVLVVFTANGVADDSVKAEQHVVHVFLPAAVPSGVTGYGVRYKCWRSDTPDEWTIELCP